MCACVCMLIRVVLHNVKTKKQIFMSDFSMDS